MPTQAFLWQDDSNPKNEIPHPALKTKHPHSTLLGSLASSDWFVKLVDKGTMPMVAMAITYKEAQVIQVLTTVDSLFSTQCYEQLL